ncbi:helix-turn-helix transcriptional regulator [Parabacteroides sp. PF5-6]|uniref:helix-turn-helix domain-containing protein n=1 Tax=Parabacteroides sp. PF5-6 TaxID=1742403 RepID=UPI002406A455|nr:helix-turn-helix transcriptional regulator [Parabacteroides sp. PF5-6]MDF9830383.1 DNA-binding XRE family transcriptional regulator [Parabacteroides sp. PF5-6]
MELKEISKDIYDVDAWLDQQYGKVGTSEREEFRREAYAYCMGQIIHDARKQEKMTQTELAERIGTNKSYISKVEKGVVEPGISTFCRIIDALGLKIEIVKPIV